MSFFEELRRRNVLRVAAGYALFAWMLIEAGSVLLPTFGASDEHFRIYVLVVIAGFVVSLVVAWVFEITPDGIRLESDIDRQASRPRTSRSGNAGLVALLGAALLVSLGFNLVRFRDDAGAATDPGLDSVAILPFKNRSSNPENGYFADGLHDDLLNRLAEIETLRVIAGSSVAGYRDSGKSGATIADELGVAAVIEGAVQRDGNRVLVFVSLYDAENNNLRWSDRFEENADLESVFGLQAALSKRIAAELQSVVSPADRLRLDEVPTRDPMAFRLYVDAMGNLERYSYESLLQAKGQFEAAVDIDPEFARAHAGLAETLVALTVAYRALAPGDAFPVAERQVARALEIDPDFAEAYAVRGLLAMQRWLPTRTGAGSVAAEQDFHKALALNSNLSKAYAWFSTLRLHEGDLDGAVALLLESLGNDPGNRQSHLQLPYLLALRGENDRATAALLDVMQRFPDWPAPYDYLARHLQKLGRLDEAYAWTESLRALTDDPLAGAGTLMTLLAFGEVQRISALVAAADANLPGRQVWAAHELFRQGNPRAAMQLLETLPDGALDKSRIVYPLLARSAVDAGELETAAAVLLRAYPALGLTPARIDRFNADAAVLLAWVYLREGDAAAAGELLRTAEPVVATMPRGGYAGHGILDVKILALLGRHDEALTRFGGAVSDGFVSDLPFDAWSLDANPMLGELARDPRFASLRETMRDSLDRMHAAVDGDTADLEALRERTQSTSGLAASVPGPP